MGVDVVRSGDDRQLLRQQEIPGVAVRNIDQLAFLALALYVFL